MTNIQLTQTKNTAPVTQSEKATSASEDSRSWASAALDVLEHSEGYNVIADIPGVSKENVEIEYLDGELRILARRPENSSENWPDEYRRTVRLSKDIDANSISAELTHGVLTLSILKSPAAQPRRISVQNS